MQKKVVGGIMDWDGSYTQIRFHSGRTDSDFGHNDYQNASRLGSYHWHHKEGPHLHPHTTTYCLQNPLDKTKHELGSAEVKSSKTYFLIKKIVSSLPMTVAQDSNKELQIFTTQHHGNPQIVGDAKYRPINIYINYSNTKDDGFLPHDCVNVFDVTTNSIVNLGLNVLYKNGELYISIEDARKIISLDDYYKYVSLDKNNCYHFEIISSTHNAINELGKSYAIDDANMWSLWEIIKWGLAHLLSGGKTGDEYIHDFKIQWIHSYREIIKDASDKYDIPALVLAGVLYVEVGGQPPIFDDGVYYIRDNFMPEVVDGIADIIQMPRLSGEAIRTSFGDISMQIRVAAEVMDYPEPNNLSDGEIDAIIESLKTPEIGLFICAKHLRGLKNVDFQNLSKDELTDEQIRIITTRYNRGAGRTLEEILNNTDYGDRIINNKSAILDALE